MSVTRLWRYLGPVIVALVLLGVPGDLTLAELQLLKGA